MSYSIWTTCGIGFCIDSLSIDTDKFLAAIKTSPLPIVDKNFEKLCKDCGYDIYAICDELVDAFNIELGCHSVANIVAYLMKYNHTFLFNCTLCNDFDGNAYILYEPKFPWNLSEQERTLTNEKLINSFVDFLKTIVTDESAIEIKYQEVSNGG